MSEKKESTLSPNDLKRNVKSFDMSNHVTPQGISRERSFIRSSNPQNHHNKVSNRRSLGFQQQQAQHMRKPLEIYRPPSK
jgi:hypothetical protein